RGRLARRLASGGADHRSAPAGPRPRGSDGGRAAREACGARMNILMLTNTFTPHVGGVARSVEAFTAHYRARGHRVLVVAPEFDEMPENETDVVRIPSVPNIAGSGFSLALPVPGYLSDVLD